MEASTWSSLGLRVILVGICHLHKQGARSALWRTGSIRCHYALQILPGVPYTFAGSLVDRVLRMRVKLDNES